MDRNNVDDSETNPNVDEAVPPVEPPVVVDRENEAYEVYKHALNQWKVFFEKLSQGRTITQITDFTPSEKEENDRLLAAYDDSKKGYVQEIHRRAKREYDEFCAEFLVKRQQRMIEDGRYYIHVDEILRGDRLRDDMLDAAKTITILERGRNPDDFTAEKSPQ